MVPQSDTVINPWTVVVKPAYTHIYFTSQEKLQERREQLPRHTVPTGSTVLGTKWTTHKTSGTKCITTEKTTFTQLSNGLGVKKRNNKQYMTAVSD